MGDNSKLRQMVYHYQSAAQLQGLDRMRPIRDDDDDDDDHDHDHDHDDVERDDHSGPPSPHNTIARRHHTEPLFRSSTAVPPPQGFSEVSSFDEYESRADFSPGKRAPLFPTSPVEEPARTAPEQRRDEWEMRRSFGADGFLGSDSLNARVETRQPPDQALQSTLFSSPPLSSQTSPPESQFQSSSQTPPLLPQQQQPPQQPFIVQTQSAPPLGDAPLRGPAVSQSQPNFTWYYVYPPAHPAQQAPAVSPAFVPVPQQSQPAPLGQSFMAAGPPMYPGQSPPMQYALFSSVSFLFFIYEFFLS